MTTISLFLFLFFPSLLLSATLPNIITIITDDHGNADSSFNYAITQPNKTPPIITKNLDALAKKGIILKRMLVQNICSPTRVAFLTTRYPNTLGNSFPARPPVGDLKPHVTTFLHQLRKIGYSTHLVGKWGIDGGGMIYNNKLKQWQPNNDRYGIKGPLARGFDTFYGLLSSGHNHFTKQVLGMPDWHKYNATHILHAPDKLDVEKDVSSTDIFTRETIKIIKSNDKPFFIQLSFSMPHDPLQVESKYMEHETCKDKSAYRRKKYCGMVMNVDYGIGEIVKTLKQQKLLDNTIIVFFADNGGYPMVGGFNYPFRGGKSSNYEGGIRVQSFIHAPKIFNNAVGEVYKPMIHVTDIGVTLLNILMKRYEIKEEVKVSVNKFLEESNGVDFTDAFSKLPKSNGNNDGPRNTLIVESNGWRNTSVYIKNIGSKSYKLMLGFQGVYETFSEPDTSWIYNSKDRTFFYSLTQIINDFLSWISPDLFFLEWSTIMVIGEIRQYFDCTHGLFVDQHLLGPIGNAYEYRDFTIPYLNWTYILNEYNRCPMSKIDPLLQLYEINSDPYEKNNLAFKDENKELVMELYNELRDLLVRQNNPPDSAGIFYMFKQFIFYIKIVWCVIIFGFIGFNVFVCMKIKQICCGVKVKPKEKIN